LPRYSLDALARDTNTSPRERSRPDWISTASLNDLAEASLSMLEKNASASS